MAHPDDGPSGHTPPRRRRARRAGAAALFAALLAGLGGSHLEDQPPDQPHPPASPADSPRAAGPLLEEIARRGHVTIGIRAYRRPSPDPEAPAEADEYDQALASDLARRLHAELRTVALPPDAGGVIRVPDDGPDLALGLARPGHLVVRSRAAPAQAEGGVVILPRPGRAGAAGQAPALALAGSSLCAEQGSPYADALAREHGARIKTLASAIAAISAFTAHECDGLVAAADLLERLQSAPDWAFYQRLPLALQPAFGDQASLRGLSDERDAQAIAALLEAWSHSAEGREQHRRRLSLQTLEATLLEPGSYCH